MIDEAKRLQFAYENMKAVQAMDATSIEKRIAMQMSTHLSLCIAELMSEAIKENPEINRMTVVQIALFVCLKSSQQIAQEGQGGS